MSANVRSAFEQQLEICKNFLRNNDRTPDTPYTTFHHRDLWMKNFLIKRGIQLNAISLLNKPGLFCPDFSLIKADFIRKKKIFSYPIESYISHTEKRASNIVTNTNGSFTNYIP